MTDKDKITNADEILDNIVGGIMPPMPKLTCKSCGKEISVDDYGKYNGQCKKCGTNGGGEGNW